MRALQKCVVAALSAVSLFNSALPVQAENITEGEAQQIAQAVSSIPEIRTGASLDALTRDIVCKEIELLKLDTNYRLYNGTFPTMARRRLVAALSTAAYATAEAGNIVTFTNAFHYHTIPEYFHHGTSSAGPLLIMLGEAIFVGRTVTDSLLDACHARYVKTLGFDRRTFEARGEKLLDAICSLLAQRQAIVAASADAVAIQEQAVLADLADLERQEFATEFGRGKKHQVWTVAVRSLENFTSGTGLAGGVLQYRAGLLQREHYVGPAGICFILSGTGFISSQVVARYLSLRAQRRAEAKILAGKKLTPEAQLSADKAKFAELTVGNPVAIERRKTYDVMQAMLDKEICLNQVETKEEFHKFLHDEFINFAEGGANIAAGSILAKAGFGFHNGIGPSEITNARHFLTRFGAAAITFTPTAGGGVIDTPAEELYGEYRHRQDCKAGVCAPVVLNTRLTVLNAAQKTFQ